MNKSLAVLLFVIISFFPRIGNAGFYSAGDVYSFCTSQEKYIKDIDLAECRGYVTGVFDLAAATTLKGEICFGEGVSIKQIIKIFTRHIDEHPEKMHLTADSVIETAVYKAFKCKT